MKTLSALVALLLLAVAFAACTNTRPPTTQPALIPDVRSPIADVPIPAGFSMDKNNSNSYVVPNSNLRIVNHNYKGSEDLLPVVRFYRDQLPAHGWALGAQHQVGDEIRLDATKGDQVLIVTMWQGTLHTHVNVRIDPAGRTTK